MDFPIICETPHWIAVNKPAGLLVHPSKPSDTATLWNRLKELLAYELTVGGRIAIINRLDRETSGVVLVAKTSEAARSLSRLMQEGRMCKCYLAVVHGWPQADIFCVDAPMLRLGAVMESRIWLKQGIHPCGSKAITRFSVECRLTCECGPIAVVRACPETGRTHQIRVHLANYGHPVVGDKLYGPDDGMYLEFMAKGWTQSLESRLHLRRHALHSWKLSWIQPNGRSREITAEWPDDLQRFTGWKPSMT